MRTAFLLILGLMLVNNTLSPQYLIWLAPFMAFLSPIESGLAIVISVLTYIYFHYWNDVITLQPMATNILVLRNILLIVLFFFSLVKAIKRHKS